jgi:phage terminase small subunit
MAALSNARHERFAQALAKGKTQIEAHASAGYKSHDQNAARMIGNERIKARVAELQERAAEKTVCTVADIAAQLDEDRKFARQLDNPAAAISATMGKAKVLGLIVDKSELTGKNGAPFPIMSVMLVDGEFPDDHPARGAA